MKKKIINLVLIGAGAIGKLWAEAIKKVKTAQLRCVVDTRLEKALEISQGIKNCRAEKDFKKILADKALNAVLIATPHKFLAPITYAALKAGKHVLCEKPVGISSAEIKKNIDLAKKNKLVYMAGFNHRYHSAFLLVKEKFDSGEIGKVLFIRARYGFGGRPEYEKEWRNKKALGGGELLDQGVHMIDLAKYFLGEIKDITGFAENLFWNSVRGKSPKATVLHLAGAFNGVEDNGFVLLRTKDRKVAMIHVSWTNWDPIHSFEIYGTKGFLKVEGLGRKYGGSEKLILGMRSENFVGLPEEKVILCNPEANNSLTRILKEFSDALKAGRETKPSGLEVYKTLKIVERIYKEN